MLIMQLNNNVVIGISTGILYHMIYQDGGRKNDSKPIQDALAGVLAIELLLLIIFPELNSECSVTSEDG